MAFSYALARWRDDVIPGFPIHELGDWHDRLAGSCLRGEGRVEKKRYCARRGVMRYLIYDERERKDTQYRV